MAERVRRVEPEGVRPCRPLVLRQSGVADAADVGAALGEAFAAIRDAVVDPRPVLLVVRDEDLLGHRSPEDAALACGLLGMARAFALEGAGRGWRINAISQGEAGDAVEEAIAWLGSSSLTGQLLRATSAHLGRVWP
jgi:NAD(P)-dependent dehydrogenase (short-subunit alcohol dehydrogenase family)